MRHVSSPGPPGACSTPSSVIIDKTVIFLIVFLICSYWNYCFVDMIMFTLKNHSDNLILFSFASSG
jgi:hypothetical protein